MKTILFFTLSLFLFDALFAQLTLMKSPDENVSISVTVQEKINLSIYYKGKSVIQNSELGLQFSQAQYLGDNMKIVQEEMKQIKETWKPVVGQYSEVLNQANEYTLTLKEKKFPARDLQLIFRLYDDGVAYRYVIPESFKNFVPNYQGGETIPLIDENSNFTFDDNHTVWAANYGSYATHQETEFNKIKLNDITEDDIIGLPVLVQIEPRLYAAITEADLTDWAGMYLGKTRGKSNSLTTKLSPQHGGGNTKVNVTPGSGSPWRVIMLGEEPGDLIESQIIWNLNDPCAIEDPSWIKPGISAWDHWWSGEVKMDTETIKEYIDLASDMGWEYMLVDWNWYGPPFGEEVGGSANPDADITTVVDEVDMQGIIKYANNKNVDILVWLLWEHVEKQMEEAFPLYEQWGVKGVKIDFMARDDQWMVNWYHKVVKKAAEHHLTVDFHGAYKPTGWTRTYPNLLTREGVLGNEYSKWSSRITPEHNVTLPFTRMLAGQMDYTPGAFLNKAMGQFRNGAPAQAMGTRCHQLAMFVVYYSPLTVACDHPDNYKNQPGIEFLKEVPTVWEDTKVLNGEVGEYITMARKKGDTWYVGSMTNSNWRIIDIDLEFLGDGNWELHYFQDAKDADQDADQLEMGKIMVVSDDKIKIEMAPGGGYAAYIVKK